MKKPKSAQKRVMSSAEVKEFVKSLLCEYGDIFHEWNTRKADQFFKASGISKRNWRIYMRHAGMADGVCWTLRAIADEEGNISHVRAWQIVRQTRKNIERFAVAFRSA